MLTDLGMASDTGVDCALPYLHDVSYFTNVFPPATDPVGASDLSAPDDEDYEDYEEGEESETDADDPVLENLEESVLSMQIIHTLGLCYNKCLS